MTAVVIRLNGSQKYSMEIDLTTIKIVKNDFT